MTSNRKYLVVIQAGGYGKRMNSLTKGVIPKPMLTICGKSMIECQLDMLATCGVSEFVIITGHLGDIIEKYFNDISGCQYNIRCIHEPFPLGSAGALFLLKNILGQGNYTDIIFLFSDIMFAIDLKRMEKFHEEIDADITLLAHPNSHPADSDLIVVDSCCRVIGIDSKNNKRNYYYRNLVNAGIYILKRDVVESLYNLKPMDMETDIIYPGILSGKNIFAYRTPEFVKDAGTPERFKMVSCQWHDGIQKKKCLRQKQKCIFLDRDGTINEYRGNIVNDKDFVLIDGVIEAIRKINSSEYLAVLITNQPVVAKGMCSVSDVEKIHMKLETLLGESGVYLDDIMFCPHHPDRGYVGENPLYKRDCECRKPKVGMIDEVIKKYNVDATLSYMIGDTTVDIKTGINAGLKTILVQTGEAGKDCKFNAYPDAYAKDLLDAVNMILGDGDKR